MTYIRPAHTSRVIAGCHCPGCDGLRAARRRRYKRLPMDHVDPTETANHIKQLLRDGWTKTEIAERSGMSKATVTEITAGVYKTIQADTAAAILGVTGIARNSHRVPALGSMRRLEALACLGWTMRESCEAAGLEPEFYAWTRDKKRTTISRASAEAIAAMYEQRCMTTPEMTPARKRTRTIAHANGYLPPLSWDNIDTDRATEAWLNVRDRRDTRKWAS